jgi:asparagine N-glycosylation enzyme membrane subunit Stt3
VQISFLGFTDHHIAEVLISIMAYMFFIRSLNNGSLASAIISGIMIGISFLTWQGAPIFTGILLFYAIIQLIYDRITNTMSNYLVLRGAVSFLSAVIVLAIFYIWTPWQHSITYGVLSYFQPLFYTFDGKFLGWQFFNNPVWDAFTLSFYSAIAGLLWFLYSFRKGMDKGKLFFAVWSLIILVLALFQRRFACMLAVNVAILSGFFIDEILQKSIHKYLPGLIYIQVFMLLVIPNLSMSYELSQFSPKPSADWYDSLTWLKYNTPEMKSEPQYGIMNWWDYSNWILYISKRPVVSNNFQIGGDEAARFFTAQNESMANMIMDKRKARYVIVDHRMIYESEENHYDLFDKPTKNINIFEYLKSAKITGKASSNETIIIAGKIITNKERIFDYMQETKADDKGYFEFTVPYSKDSPYKTRLLNDYELRYGNTGQFINISINISENDVMNGNVIKVN